MSTTLPTRSVVLTPGLFWRVEDGDVDVFLGPRELVQDRLLPLASLQPGSLVGGLPLTASGRTQIGMASLGASLRPISVSTAAGLPDAAAALAPWLGGLLSTGHTKPPPRVFVPIRSGQIVTLGAETTLRSTDKLTILTVLSGRVSRHGDARSTIDAGSATLIGVDDWVTTVDGAVLESQDLAVMLSESAGWTLLLSLVTRALNEAEGRVFAARAIEESRQEKRQHLDDRGAELPDRLLAALLSNDKDTDFAEKRRGETDATFAAAVLVARVSGIELVMPAVTTQSSRTDILQVIAHASRIRVRSVRLDGEWWKNSPEPMVGQLADNHRPVALIPRRGGVDVRDPSDGTIIRMSKATTALITPRAEIFYRSLPEHSLTAKDVTKFAARGTFGSLTWITLTGVAVAIIGLLVPILTGIILGTLVPQGDSTLIADLCLILLAAAAASGLLTVSQNLILLRLQGHLDGVLQAAVWDRLISLPGSFFRNRTVGSLVTSILSVSAAREVLAASGVQTIFAVIVGLANMALIFYFSIALGLMTLVVVAIAIAVAGVANSSQVRRQRTAFSASQELNAKTYELVRGVAKLRAAGAEDRAFAHWAPTFAAQRRATFRARVAQNGLTVFNAALVLGGTIALFLISSQVVHIQTAAFLIVYTAFAQVLGAVVAVSNTVATVVTVVPYLESLSPVIRTEPEVSADKLDAGELVGEIELNQVTFRYNPDGPAILQGVTFHAAPGEFIAVVGPSGSGKSTLLRLLLGFEQPETGSVLYDGRDLVTLDVGSVRRQCGVVLQDGALFAGDLASNIAGSGAYSHDEILAAAHLAGLDEDIASMPLGLSTIVSEGAATLSGGQRQRLMIARAMISRPRILFFDEATSALDNRTQEVVTRSTRTLNATRIVIAHRLSTVKDADRIIVIDAGRIVQNGTYPKLLAEDGMFRTLAARQRA
ncbi:MAG: NHLP bacteriocin export ABC transporter permease/ATPase subunit [Kineosporiaceae bacterium]|nr:NHLP bacteriocin export ABC transporter permease/ATPase subunit [Aeromicrobium sp.]